VNGIANDMINTVLAGNQSRVIGAAIVNDQPLDSFERGLFAG